MTKPDFDRTIEAYIMASSGPYVSIERGANIILEALTEAYAAGRADERERCAKISDKFLLDPLTSSCNPLGVVDRIISSIRQGGEE